MSKYYIRIFFLTVILLLPTLLAAQPDNGYKKVVIRGTVIYNAAYLNTILELNRLAPAEPAFELARQRVLAFYQSRGYYLAQCYLVVEDNERLIMFVDEGRLGRIVFLHLNSINTLRAHYSIDLEYNIYNRKAVDKALEQLKENYGFTAVTAEIIPTRKYEGSLLQLDESFTLPVVGETRLPFFREYGYANDLHISIINGHGEREGFDYNLKTSYSKGFRPGMGYARSSLFLDDDRLECDASMGIKYLYDFNPLNKPQWTYMQGKILYAPPPAV